MGVYIYGMEMPKGCTSCKIKMRNGKKMVCPLLDEEWDIHDPMSADHKLDNCPLLHVQPHGRLIDADAEVARVQNLYNKAVAKDPEMGCVSVYEGEIAVLKLAPTVIPAEQKGE